MLFDATQRPMPIPPARHGLPSWPDGHSRHRAHAASTMRSQRPLVALVVQGTKYVTMGEQAFTFSAGASLLITADVPTVSQITRASIAAPYFSLVLDLDISVIAELSAEMKAAPVFDDAPVRVEPTDSEVADAALRLMRLMDRPASVPVLQAQLVREMHYWLLAGRHGSAIETLLGYPDSHAQRVARAVAVLRAEFVQPLPVERLAAVAGMSPSSFHQHSPRRDVALAAAIPEAVRLIEARRQMMSEGALPAVLRSQSAMVSVSQFTREYGRIVWCRP